MENNGKSLILQRTLGAAVLVAAAATLVPLVLDGDGLKSSREKLTIPDEPTFELQLDEHQQPKVRMLQAKGAIDRAQQESVAAVDADAGSPQTQQPATENNPSMESHTSDAQVNENQSMEDVIQKLSRPGTETLNEPATKMPVTTEPVALGGDVADSWTIQMGAFKDRGNAERTVATLVGKGYRAYLGTQTPGVYRVLVGPEIRRDRAEQLRDRVAADTGTRGVVVRYLP